MTDKASAEEPAEYADSYTRETRSPFDNVTGDSGKDQRTKDSPVFSRLAFIFGMLSIIFCAGPTGLASLWGLIAIVAGITSLKTINRGVALAGLIMGTVGFLASVIVALSRVTFF